MPNSCIQARTIWAEAPMDCIVGYDKQSGMEKCPKKNHTTHLKKGKMRAMKPHFGS